VPKFLKGDPTVELILVSGGPARPRNNSYLEEEK
jgi:hypothetical protein